MRLGSGHTDTREGLGSRVLKEMLPQAALLLLCLIVLYPDVFLRGEMAVPGTILFELDPWRQHAPEGWEVTRNNVTLESLTVFAPWYSMVQQSFADGHWPLWNGLQYTGMPLLGNYQSTVFYPLHVLHTFLDVFLCMTLYNILKLWLCGMMAYGCARGMRIGVWTSRFVSVAWMLSAFNVIWCYWPLPDVTAWLPVFFLGVEWTVQKQYRRGFFAMAAGSTLFMLAGHPETAFAMALMTGLYFVLRLLLERTWGRDLRNALAACAGAWALTLLVCAVQLVPFVEFVVHSYTFGHRAAPDAVKYFIPGHAVVALWVPRFFGASADGNFWSVLNWNYVSLVYAGIAVWVGLSLTLARGPWERTERNRAIALAIPCVLGFCLAMGFPGVRTLTSLPVFSSMRNLYHCTFAMWALPLLAAIGIEHWRRGERTWRDLRRPILALGVIALIVAGFYGFYRRGMLIDDMQLAQTQAAGPHTEALRACGVPVYGHHGYAVRQNLTAAGIAAACLASVVLALRWRKALVPLLVLLLAADLLYAARNMLPTTPREQVFPRTDLTDYLAEQGKPLRLSVHSTPIADGVMSPYRIEQFYGYDAIFPERIERLKAEAHPHGWASVEPVCSIETYLHPYPTFSKDTGQDHFETIEVIDNIEVNRNRRAMPRAYLVGRVKAIADKDALFAAMCAEDFDPRAAVLTEAPPADPPNAASRDLGSVSFREWGHMAAVMDVDAKERCCLVLSDAYYPGWRAYIDGDPVEMFPAYYAFRGIIVPEGAHDVAFRYEPRSFTVGMAVSVATLALAALGSVLLLRRASTRSAGHI